MKGTRHFGDWRFHSPTSLVSRVFGLPPLKSIAFSVSSESAPAWRVPRSPHLALIPWDPRGASQSGWLGNKSFKRGWMGETRIKWALLTSCQVFKCLVQVFQYSMTNYLLWDGGHPVHYMFSSIPGLYYLNASNLCSIVTTKSVIIRYCQCELNCWLKQ